MRLPDFEKHIHEMIHLSVYGGICAGDYDGDGLADLYITSPAGGNRLYRNKGDFHFEDVTEAAGVSSSDLWGTGACFVDIDNDGDLDIYACGYRTANRLFINQGRDAEGRVRFIEKAKDFGLNFNGASMMMAFADIDNDGDLDAYLATTAVPPPPGVRLRFEYQGGRPTVPKELQEYWGIVNLPNGQTHPTEAGQFDRLFRNDGGRFTEITAQAGITGAYFTLGALWCDFDRDGWPDLYVANDYLGPDMLYRNQRNGSFLDVSRQSMPHTPWSSMGLDVADLNNDGLVDLMATDMLGSTDYRRKVMAGETTKTAWFLDVAEPRQYTHNAVYLNSGAGPFMEVAWQAGLAATDWTWGPRLEDFDNDGRVDVFIANGMLRDVQNADLGLYADRTFGGGSAAWAKFWASQPMQKETNFAFRNLGDLRFENAGAPWGLNRFGVSLGIATTDFDNDGALDLAVNNADAPVSIYRNRATNNAICVRLHGKAGNRFGIGATVQIKTAAGQQTRYQALNRSWLSASDPMAHFGLGVAGRIELLQVIWPGGGSQSFTNLEANRLYTITESSTTSQAPAFKPLLAETNIISIETTDSPSDDFKEHPLLPKRISGRGMALAWDGKSDAFAGNPSRLFRDFQQINFTNYPVQSAAAIFVDADADKDSDLFVVGERDELFLRNAVGAYVSAATNIAAGSCLAAADFDKDGAVDIFIGGYSTASSYPRAIESRLVSIRDKKIVDITPDLLKNPGLVTGAVWADVDGDTWPDLFLAIEWGPVRFFRNDHGKLVEGAPEAGLAGRSGLWSAISAADVDGDGDIDLVLGNIGLNTPYHASPEHPALVFFGDLDGSGATNLLQAHFNGEFGFPDRGLDALVQAMPVLRQKFSSFDQFARAPIEKITTMQRLGRSYRVEANTLESGLLMNNGKGQFTWSPFPALAQIAPVRDIAIGDLTGDGKPDIVLAQNDFSTHPEIGRMDGGLSLLLVNDGHGGFAPMWPNESGIAIFGEARRVMIAGQNADKTPRLIFGVSR